MVTFTILHFAFLKSKNYSILIRNDPLFMLFHHWITMSLSETHNFWLMLRNILDENVFFTYNRVRSDFSVEHTLNVFKLTFTYFPSHQ